MMHFTRYFLYIDTAFAYPAYHVISVLDVQERRAVWPWALLWPRRLCWFIPGACFPSFRSSRAVHTRTATLPCL